MAMYRAEEWQRQVKYVYTDSDALVWKNNLVHAGDIRVSNRCWPS
jgi:hypothetical protein